MRMVAGNTCYVRAQLKNVFFKCAILNTVGSRIIKPFFFTPISRRVKGLSEEEVKKIKELS